jgi:ABC-type taurine transport system ATPase subunit
MDDWFDSELHGLPQQTVDEAGVQEYVVFVVGPDGSGCTDIATFIAGVWQPRTHQGKVTHWFPVNKPFGS